MKPSLFDIARNRVRLYTRRTKLVEAWVQPVEQPVVWIAQLPRSGGTMLARLFDGHPQLHGVPKPVSFGGEPLAAWPDRDRFSFVTPRRKLDMSAVNGAALVKKASNVDQSGAPIYFDGVWYRRLCRTWRPSSSSADDVRGGLSVLFTAFFNAWRNYQNLYGDKRFVVVQSIVDPDADMEQTYRNFRAAYPDGHWLFSFRPPEDWLASMTLLRHSRAEYGGLEGAMSSYANLYEGVSRLIGRPGFIGVDFRDFVLSGGDAMMELACERLGIDPDPALRRTTTNSMPAVQNSSHAVKARAGVDRSRAASGREMIAEFEAFPEFERCTQAYERCLDSLKQTAAALSTT